MNVPEEVTGNRPALPLLLPASGFHKRTRPTRWRLEHIQMFGFVQFIGRGLHF